MSKFVLTAQIALQAPSNTQQVVNQIRRQLQGVSVNINVNANTKQLAQANNQLNSVTRSSTEASRSVSELGKTLGAAARRFGAISIATGTFLGLTRAIKNSLGDAIEFERQMVILSQTTGQTVRQLSGLYNEINRLSASLGVSSDGLVKTAIVLAQSGMEARKTKAALEVLAKTQLAASFDNIVDTTEGAIAIISQFRNEAIQAGGDIKFLEKSLEAINQVSKRFAVESSDLIAVIRRSGGAFEAAGGSLNELLALFTSVRATTRESAETISTGLRTIFTRIQRTDTIKALQDLGIALQDVEGKFVGPYEAIKRISEGLSSIDPRDFRFAAIVEELGGFRQIGKVIPLIKQFAVAQDALNTAQSSSGSLTQDVVTAQQALANQIAKVQEKFQSLIRDFTDSEAFRSIAGGALQFAEALIKVADALKPLLPMIVGLAAVQIGKGLVPAIGALAGVGRRRNQGGPIRAFATGGLVPGQGNRDTVPAVLTPGEFVIRKSSVKKIGAANLAHMNSGGTVQHFDNGTSGTGAKKKKKDLLVSMEENRARVAQKSPAAAKLLDELDKGLEDSLYYGSPKLMKSINKEAAIKDKKKEKAQLQQAKMARLENYRKQIESGQEEIAYDEYNPDQKFKMNKSNSKRNAKRVKRLAGVLAKNISQDDDVQEFNLGGLASVGAITLSPLKDTTRQKTATITKGLLEEKNKTNFGGIKDTSEILRRGNEKKYNINVSGIKDDNIRKELDTAIANGLVSAVNHASDIVGQKVSINKVKHITESEAKSFVDLMGAGVKGAIFESLISHLAYSSTGEYPWQAQDENELNRQRPFDFIGNLGDINKTLFGGPGINEQYIDAKISDASVKSDAFSTKIANQLLDEAPYKEKGATKISVKDRMKQVAKALMTHHSKEYAIPGEYRRPEEVYDIILKELYKLSNTTSIDDLKETSLPPPASATKPTLDTWLSRANIDYDYIAGGGKNTSKWIFSSASVPMAKGGSASDTVPAMLTPGEFVVNKKSAQRIGYGALNRMNKTGVAGFAKGGSVGGVMKFNNGNTVPRISGTALQNFDQAALKNLSIGLNQLTKNAELSSRIFNSIGTKLLENVPAMTAVKQALKEHEAELEANKVVIKALTDEELKELKTKQSANKLATKDQPNKTAKTKSDCVKLCDPINLNQAVTTATAPANNDAQTALDKAAEQHTETVKKENQSRLASIRSIAQSAQNFVFLSSSVGAVAVQFLGFNDSLSKAITETLGFASVATGMIGTIVDFGASIWESVSTTIMNARATRASSVALTNLARSAAVAAAAQGGAGKAGGASAGAGVLSTIFAVLPPPIKIVVAILVALAAALLSGLYLYKAYNKAEAERIKKSNDALAQDIESGKASIASRERYIAQEEEAARKLVKSYWFVGSNIMDSTKALAAAFIDTVISIKQLDDKLQQLEMDKALTPFQKAGKGIEAYAQANDELIKTTKKAREERAKVAKDAGLNPTTATEDDFSNADAKNAFKSANDTITRGAEFFAKVSSELASRLQTQFEEAIKTTDFDPSKGIEAAFEEIKNANKPFVNSLNTYENVIRNNAIEAARNAKTQDEAAKILAEAEMRIYDTYDALERQAEASKKAAASAIAFKSAMEAAQIRILAFKGLTVSLNKQIKESEKFANTISSINGIVASEMSNFTMPELEGLSDLTQISDIDSFKKQLQNLTSTLGADGQEINNILSATADAFKAVEDSMVNVAGIGKIGEDFNALTEDAIRGALDPLKAALPTEMQGFIGTLQNNLREAVQGGLTPEEAKQAFEPLMNALKAYTDLLSKLIQTSNSYLNSYNGALQALNQAYSREVALRQKIVDIQARGAERMSQATDIDLSSGFKEMFRQNRRREALQAAGVQRAPTDIAGMGADLAAAERRRAEIAGERETMRQQGGLQTEQAAKLAEEDAKLVKQTQALRDNLENLSDQSDKAADTLSEIEKEKSKRGLAMKTMEDFVTGGLDEQTKMLRDFAGAQIAMQTGTLQNFDTETRKGVMSLLTQLGSVDQGIEQFRKNLIAMDAMRMGINPNLAIAAANQTPKEQQLMQNLANITQQELQAAEALKTANENSKTALEQNTQAIRDSITAFDAKSKADLALARQQAQNAENQRAADKQDREERDKQKRADAEKKRAEREARRNEKKAQAESQAQEQAKELNTQTVANQTVTNQTVSQSPTPIYNPQNPIRMGAAKGGSVPVYASVGKSIFKPKGTDTVPAMLTPGEFVIQKSAVDQYGTDFMQSVNAGTYAKGGVIYAQDGIKTPKYNPFTASIPQLYDPQYYLNYQTQLQPAISEKQKSEMVLASRKEQYGKPFSNTPDGLPTTEELMKRRFDQPEYDAKMQQANQREEASTAFFTKRHKGPQPEEEKSSTITSHYSAYDSSGPGPIQKFLEQKVNVGNIIEGIGKGIYSSLSGDDTFSKKTFHPGIDLKERERKQFLQEQTERGKLNNIPTADLRKAQGEGYRVLTSTGEDAYPTRDPKTGEIKMLSNGQVAGFESPIPGHNDPEYMKMVEKMNRQEAESIAHANSLKNMTEAKPDNGLPPAPPTPVAPAAPMPVAPVVPTPAAPAAPVESPDEYLKRIKSEAYTRQQNRALTARNRRNAYHERIRNSGLMRTQNMPMMPGLGTTGTTTKNNIAPTQIATDQTKAIPNPKTLPEKPTKPQYFGNPTQEEVKSGITEYIKQKAEYKRAKTNAYHERVRNSYGDAYKQYTNFASANFLQSRYGVGKLQNRPKLQQENLRGPSEGYTSKPLVNSVKPWWEAKPTESTATPPTAALPAAVAPPTAALPAAVAPPTAAPVASAQVQQKMESMPTQTAITPAIQAQQKAHYQREQNITTLSGDNRSKTIAKHVQGMFDLSTIWNNMLDTYNFRPYNQQVAKKHNGGPIYASNGMGIFKPRGTDTIPAMLTPGEFVMQKSAVDQYGAGFMNSVNNGQAPGYNTGGIVYRQGGGIMDRIAGAAGGAMKAIGIDPNSVQNLTGTLTQTFEKFIGNVPSAFAPIVDGLNNFMNQMANFAGISLDMKVNVDGMLNIGGINTQSIVDAVKNGIGEMVANEVKKQLPDNKDFKTA